MPPANGQSDREHIPGSSSVGKNGTHSALKPQRANLKKMSPGVSLKDSSGSENRCQQGGQVQKCNPSPGSHPSLCSFLSTLWREGWGLGPACWITPLFAHSHTEKPVRGTGLWKDQVRQDTPKAKDRGTPSSKVPW